ncbi:MAG: hypothetical protein KAT04_08980 [Methylococcales bacterium]|nr:hypothetical protein [Methylococcales bacterium]
MSVDSIVDSIIKDVPKSVAAGVVDMGTGLLLGVKTVDEHPQDVLDMLAAATHELFEGDSVTGIENIFKKARGDSSTEHYFKEVMVTSTNLLHVFSRLHSDPNIVISAVCQQGANLGLVIMKMRGIADKESI